VKEVEDGKLSDVPIPGTTTVSATPPSPRVFGEAARLFENELIRRVSDPTHREPNEEADP